MTFGRRSVPPRVTRPSPGCDAGGESPGPTGR